MRGEAVMYEECSQDILAHIMLKPRGQTLKQTHAVKLARRDKPEGKGTLGLGARYDAKPPRYILRMQRQVVISRVLCVLSHSLVDGRIPSCRSTALLIIIAANAACGESSPSSSSHPAPLPHLSQRRASEVRR